MEFLFGKYFKHLLSLFLRSIHFFAFTPHRNTLTLLTSASSATSTQPIIVHFLMVLRYSQILIFVWVLAPYAGSWATLSSHMRFEFFVDRELDDGRYVVVNNSRLDVPQGTVFTALYARTTKLVDGEIQEQLESPFVDIQLKVIEVEFWRKEWWCVPSGHNAAVRFNGAGLSLLKEAVQNLPLGWRVFLASD